jgi:A/G-specific adenine glycosylase
MNKKPKSASARTTPPRIARAPRCAPEPSLPAPAAHLAAGLASWFEAHKRDLPWREERTAYRVWLSEVMLQQTRVSVVQDYYRRFLARFPDVHALAAAHEDDVLSMWSGLGYYSRGRNLHRAAQRVVSEHAGEFPRTADALRTLPGVGAYTASAIASLAFEERSAVVDGNVARVLMRACGDETPIDSPAGKRALAARAQALIDVAPAAGAHNEAMMELGALVCTPKSPACGECPWRRVCVARREDTVASIPKKERKGTVRALDVACLVVVNGDRVLLERRASHGMFGGLYAPPAEALGPARLDAGDAPARTAVEAVWRALADARTIALAKKLPPPLIVKRQLTHRDLTFHCLRVEAKVGGDGFLSRSALREVGVSAAVRAVLETAWPEHAAQPRLFS